MAKTYTYDDFLKALEQSGYGTQFSQADLNLARNNPDAGMSLLSYKTDYANATTDEMRALANQGAESVRSSYGGYTGGGDGGSFKLNPLSPNQYSYDAAPEFDDRYAERLDSLIEQQQNRQPYSYAGVAPEYESRYDPQIQQTIGDILGRGEFSYDPKTDPVYSAYQKQYAREGQRATANAMGEAAAMTGGQPSSWAMTAASQAGDYYASQMADKIPELYQDAYNRYLQEYQMKLSDLNALRGLESDDYNKYRDQLSQYNTDRNFDYAAWLDQQNLSQQDIDNLRALRSDDLDLYKTKLGQYNTDREFGYSQLLDEITNQRTQRQDERDWAKSVAEYGDFSRLNALGVDTSTAERKLAIAEAIQAAEYGDFGPLASLGFDTSNAALMQQLDQAYKQAQISSVYANMPTEEERALSNAYKQAQIASLYAGMDTEEDKAIERAYKQAQIANIYSGMPTEEEKALEAAYKQAQINKMNSAESGSNFDDILALGKANASRGDYGILDALNEQYGIPTDYEQIAANTAASTWKIKSVNDLKTRIFEEIRTAKAEGDPDVQTKAGARAAITSLDGWTDSDKMNEALDAFLDELYGTNEKQGYPGPNKYRSGSVISAQ